MQHEIVRQECIYIVYSTHGLATSAHQMGAQVKGRHMSASPQVANFLFYCAQLGQINAF